MDTRIKARYNPLSVSWLRHKSKAENVTFTRATTQLSDEEETMFSSAYLIYRPQSC